MPHSWIEPSNLEDLKQARGRFRRKRREGISLKIEYDSEESAADAISLGEFGDDHKTETIVAALSHWALLYDVPFHYLLPDEQMLPENSIRFLYLDSNWVCAMLDGAFSIGRDARVDFTHDSVLIDALYGASLESATVVRPRLQGKATGATSFQSCSGFLLRSPIVTGWRGLDFEALDGAQKTLRAVRIETLADDVLLGLYLGDIRQLTIHEPPEGLHNETISETGVRRYVLRRSKDDGTADGTNHTVTIKPRTTPTAESSRTVDIRALSADLGCGDGAELALQLLKLPSYAMFYASED